MRRVLLLLPTTTYRADDFLRAAAKLQVEVLVATDRCHVLAREFTEQMTGSVAVALREEPEALAELTALHRERPFSAIVPTDDGTTVLAARAAHSLGLPHNPVAAARAARDKRLLRRRLEAAGVPQPAFHVHPLDRPFAELRAAARRLGYPCVLKPVVLSASQGVIRADDDAGLEGAYRRVRALLRRPDIAGPHQEDAEVLLLESFVPGPEVAVEGLLLGGRLRPLALFDKPDPLDGPFFEETLYVTPSRHPPPLQEAVLGTTERAAAALGLRQGPVHAELRLGDSSGGPRVIEVAGRSIGGLCSRTLRFAAGRSLEELILLCALGDPGPPEESLRREQAAAGVMMLPIPERGVLKEVAGVEAALGVPGVVEVAVTARPGEELLPLPEGSSYLGFLFARAGTPAQVEEALRQAHRRLRFSISRTLPALADRER